MIISEFAKYLQAHNKEIVENKTTVSLLCAWVIAILEKKPHTHIEKIIHSEIDIAQNNCGDFLLVAKSESGRVLTNALYNFAMSYEQHVMRKWLETKTANEFKENPPKN